MNWIEAYRHQPPPEKLGKCGFCGGATRRGNKYEPAIVHTGIPLSDYPWHMPTPEGKGK